MATGYSYKLMIRDDESIEERVRSVCAEFATRGIENWCVEYSDQLGRPMLDNGVVFGSQDLLEWLSGIRQLIELRLVSVCAPPRALEIEVRDGAIVLVTTEGWPELSDDVLGSFSIDSW